MITPKTKRKILSVVAESKKSTKEDFERISLACDGKVITDFENSQMILKTMDVADMLGVHIQTVRNLVKAGELKGHFRNKRWSGIMRDSVEEYISKQTGRKKK